VKNRSGAGNRPRAADSGEGGFTLLELLIVVALIAILTAIAVPAFKTAPTKAKEAVLKEDLYALRDVIDQYFADKGRYPASLQTLVEDGYLRKIPVDPFTDSADTWQIEMADNSGEEGSEEAGGVYDVHSGSSSTALDGTTYSEW
jgi:general secretion pathway protein G